MKGSCKIVTTGYNVVIIQQLIQGSLSQQLWQNLGMALWSSLSQPWAALFSPWL